MLLCGRCRSRVWPNQNYCPRCGLRLSIPGAAAGAGVDLDDDTGARVHDAPEARPTVRPATVRYAGQLIASAMGGIVSGLAAFVFAFLVFDWDGPGGGRVAVTLVTPVAFEPRAQAGTVNASGLVPVGDSRFFVVDDQTDNAFFELVLRPDGTQAEPLTRRVIAGLAPGVVEDFEAAALVEEAGQRVIVAISSLEGLENEATDDGFVRVRVGDDGALAGEVMPGFRDWLLANAPALASVRGGPDRLDVQGLIWDPARHALLLGVRSATETGRPLVLPLRLKDGGGAWTTDNLEVLPPVELDAGDAAHPLGVRGMARHPQTGEFLLILAQDGPPESFALYTWDGGASVHKVPRVVFAPGMRPEGIAYGAVGGRAAMVFADDNGGFYVSWERAPERSASDTNARTVSGPVTRLERVWREWPVALRCTARMGTAPRARI